LFVRKRCNYVRQRRLELAAHNRLDAQLAQMRLVHWSIQAVKTEVRTWIQASDWLDQKYRQPRGCVHGNVESYHVGGPHGVFLEGLARQIEAGDFSPGAAQPSGWRSQSKGLVAKLIRRDQYDLQEKST
jgi:hypothetical protein